MGYGVGMAKNASTLVKNINVLIVQVPPNFLLPIPNPIIFKIIFYFKKSEILQHKSKSTKKAEKQTSK